jgi:haloacid dehalogenase superfamily, subfamily IA, variant 1 with third motif having Dx(3-4)D or Dx(3-4)E
MSNNVDLLVVFDLDGTLNFTELYSVPANLKLMEKFNAPQNVRNRDFIVSTFGMTSDVFIKEFLPDSSDEIRREYLNNLRKVEYDIIPDTAKSYDNVIPMLESLKKYNITTAVCSNSSINYITRVLKSIHIFDKIDFIQESVAGCTKKETLKMLLNKLNPAKALMVGDRIFDIEAAQHNNIPSIGCTYGYNPEETNQADYIVNNPSEILPVVKKVFEI